MWPRIQMMLAYADAKGYETKMITCAGKGISKRVGQRSIAAMLVLMCAVASGGENEDLALQRAHKLLRKAMLIDGHNDLPWEIRRYKPAPGDITAFDLRRSGPGATDLGRLRAGGVSGQFWSVYIPGDLKDGRFARLQLEQFDVVRRIIESYPNELALCLSSRDIERARKAGRIASLIGMEGGHAIENSLGTLRSYYDLGARYLTLTHNVTLDWADAALGEQRHGGLTAFGKEVVREMNRLGMLVDLSHTAPSTMADALDISEAPVIFSHSSCRGLVDHARNIPDDILVRLKKNRGIAMITFVPPFVSKEVADWWAPAIKEAAASGARMSEVLKRREGEVGPAPRATLSHVADHIEHARKVAGSDHIGIGGDFFDPDIVTQGLEDVSRYPHLFAELIRRGWSDRELKKLGGENILRVMREAEAVSVRLRATRPISTATIEKLDGGTAK